MSTPPNSTPPEPFEIPNPFGRYNLLRKLGQGGMGSVYLALDTVLKRRVALKVPRELAGRQPGLVARFRREAEVLAGFQHPNICRVLDVGEIEGLHYLTMEYHEGKPLDAVLVRGKAMKAEQAARIVRKLALALQKAHDGGIVHRDLKPSNVLLTAEKDLVILDFGLARSVEADSHRLSVTGEILGTPAYMSPEQVKADPSAIGPATDVYSLGVMLYEMLCGRRPFSGPVTTILSNILNDRPHPPSTYHPRLDLSLEAVCMKALEKDPASRYTTMAEFAEALSDWLSVRTGSDTFTGVSLTRDGPRDPGTSSGAGASRGFPKGLAAAAGCLAVLLAVVLYVGTRDGTVRIVSGEPKQRPERTTPTREEARPASGPTTASGETPGSPQPLALGPKEVVDPPVPADVASPAVANPTDHAGGPRPGKERDDNALKMKLCWCPPGTFVMGSPPGEPGHEKDEGPVRVTLTRGFWLGKYELTQSQWKQVMRTTLADQQAKGASGEVVGQGPDHPMYFVSHSEAEAFCRTLTESERVADRLPAGWEYRLPTEAQWEYACRAGTTKATAFGDALGSAQANFDGKGHPYNGAETGPYLEGTVPVGRYPANRWGLHDMHGNVWEWCRDGYLENLPGGVDPSGPTGLPTCVIRGGCWNDGGAGCRSAFRFGGAPESRNNGPGFRVALIQR